jgi:hypothetical protein
MQPSRKANALSLICLGIFSFLAAGSMDNGSTSPSPSESNTGASTPSPESTKDILMSQVKLAYTWSTDGMIMTANFKIDNPTDHAFKDVEITCNHFAPSGTKIDSNTRIIYEAVKAHEKKTVNGFNMGFIHSQATSSSWKLSDLTPLD